MQKLTIRIKTIYFCKKISKIAIIEQALGKRYFLKTRLKKNLTETVKEHKKFIPRFFPLPHPSPRNRFWLTNNPWFEDTVIPELQYLISYSLKV